MKENKNGGVHTHRTPISIDNPEVRKDEDWWDELCKAHGAKNYWLKRKTKKERQAAEERQAAKKRQATNEHEVSKSSKSSKVSKSSKG